MPGKRLFVAAIFIAAATMLAACGGSESTGSSSTLATATETTDTPVTETSVAAEAPETTVATVATVATETTVPPDVDPTCDWDTPRLTSGEPGDEPAGEGSDLSQAILGSWQHTHINEGSGFVAVKPTTDIRFVLSPDRLLYCQDVEGATKQRENSVVLILEGDEIVLPSPATGYQAIAWNDDTMVWLNHFDNSLFLLQRR
jgi:hypothetical protein